MQGGRSIITAGMFNEDDNQDGNEFIENNLQDEVNYIPANLTELAENHVLDEVQKTILIAEDDEFNFLLIESLLTRNAFHILHASNGREAVHLYMTYSDICLILMDLQMPVMDGFAATKEIRKTNKVIPVIAQTAFVAPGVKEKAYSSGCNAFITKPIDPEALIMQINCLLDNSRTKVT
jgi:CheY-like chemotaxis protein